MKDRFLNKRARRLWAFLLMLGLFLQTLGSFTVRPAGQEVSDGSQSDGDAQIVPLSETETVSGSAIQITVYTGEGEKPVSAENLLKADANGELSFYLRVDFELGQDFSLQLPDKITVPSNIDGGSGFPILDAEDHVLATVTHVDNSLRFTIGNYVKDNHLTGTGHFEVGGFKYKPEPAAEAGLTGSEQLEFKDGNGSTITSVTLYFQWAEQAPWIQKTEDAYNLDGVNYRRFTILLKPGNLYEGFELTDTLENVAFTDAVAPTIQRGSAAKDMKPTETYTLVYYALEDSAMYEKTESSTVKNTGVLKASAAGGEASGLQLLSDSDLDWGCQLSTERTVTPKPVVVGFVIDEKEPSLLHWTVTLNSNEISMGDPKLYVKIGEGRHKFNEDYEEFKLDGDIITDANIASSGVTASNDVGYTYGITGLGTKTGDDTTKFLEIKYSGEIRGEVVITLKTKLDDDLFCKNNNWVQYGNTVTLASDEITGSPVSASGYQPVSSEILSKSGSYNAATRHVQWTVVLNSTGFDLNNVVMTDTIPAGQQYVTGTFQVDGTKLTVTEGNAAFSGEAALQAGDDGSTVLTYRVDELSKTTTITYETEITDLKPFYSAPSSGNYMSVGNAVELAYGVNNSNANLKQGDVSAQAEVQVSVLKKDCNYTPYSMYADWTITVNEAYMTTTNGVLIDRFTSNMELDTTSVSVKYQASESGSASDAVINYSIADDVADVEAGSVTLVYTGETEEDEDGSTWKSFRLYLPKETSGKFTVSYRTKLVDKTKTSADNTASFLCDEMGEEAGQLGIGTQKNDRPITFVLAAGGGSASGTTDANGILIIEKLKPGSYYVKQEKAAVGYTLDPLGAETTPTGIEGCRKVEVAQEHTVDNPLEVPYCNAIRTAEPTEEPEPTEGPQPIPEPTETPQPTAEPTEEPKPTATPELTPVPSRMPEATPSPKPTEVPLPTLRVTPQPTEMPTARLIFDTADENIPDIAGRKFEVRTMESEVVAEVTMDENGHFEIDELPYGEYLLVEIFDFENPEGTPFIFPIKSEGDMVQLVYKDGRLLPKTGLVDSIYFYIIGLAIAAAGAAAVVKKRREHGA